MVKKAKGAWGNRSRLYRRAKETTIKAMSYAYRDRKVRKRQFRSLWVTRINALARELGMTYSQFIAGLKRSNILLDRKQLAEIAVQDPKVFEQLVERAKQALGKGAMNCVPTK
jgi:large subunit ribosomal protein L20